MSKRKRHFDWRSGLSVVSDLEGSRFQSYCGIGWALGPNLVGRSW